MANSPVRRLRRMFDEFGAVDGVLYLLSRLAGATGGRVALYRYLFFAQPVPEQAPPPPRRAPRFPPIREVGPDDPLRARFPRPDAVIGGRYAQGSHCLAAEQDGEFVGYVWLQLGPYLEDEVRCRFVPGPAGQAAWDYDIYLVPERRLGRGFLYLWQAANSFMRERGIRWTISRVSAFNTQSIRSHQRLGASHLGSAVFLKVFGAQLMLASRRPWLHLSPGAASIPTMHLEA